MFFKINDSKKKIASVVLIDFFKTVSLLYGFDFIDSRLLAKDELPDVLKNNTLTLSSREFYELNSLYEHIVLLNKYCKKTSKIDSHEYLNNFLPILDTSVYLSLDSVHYKSVFKDFPVVEEILRYFLELRESLHLLRDVKSAVNLRLKIDGLIELLEDEEIEDFLLQFKVLSSDSFASKISMKLLEDFPDDEVSFSEPELTAIFEKKKSFISIFSYIEKSVTPVGAISTISEFIYKNMYCENGANMEQINNYGVIDKLFFHNNSHVRLNSYMDSLANSDISHSMESKANEMLKILMDNEDILSEDSNDGVFVLIMLLKVKKELKKINDVFKDEVISILEKNLPLEFRFVELELYLKNVISSLMDNKRIVSNNDELAHSFYSGIEKEIVAILDKTIIEYDKRGDSNAS